MKSLESRPIALPSRLGPDVDRRPLGSPGPSLLTWEEGRSCGCACSFLTVVLSVLALSAQGGGVPPVRSPEPSPSVPAWCPGSSEAVSEQLVLPGAPRLRPPVSPPSRLHTNYCFCPSLHPASFERILSYSPLPPRLRVPGSQVRGLLKSPSAGEEVTVGELRQSSHAAGTNLKYAC